MRKVKTYKGFIIALELATSRFQLFTKEEWAYGNGCRYPEHDTCTIEEAIEFINDWGK
jgi:hypothetical protein